MNLPAAKPLSSAFPDDDTRRMMLEAITISADPKGRKRTLGELDECQDFCDAVDRAAGLTLEETARMFD